LLPCLESHDDDILVSRQAEYEILGVFRAGLAELQSGVGWHGFILDAAWAYCLFGEPEHKWSQWSVLPRLPPLYESGGLAEGKGVKLSCGIGFLEPKDSIQTSNIRKCGTSDSFFPLVD
jgi:hypothetical protein